MSYRIPHPSIQRAESQDLAVLLASLVERLAAVEAEVRKLKARS